MALSSGAPGEVVDVVVYAWFTVTCPKLPGAIAFKEVSGMGYEMDVVEHKVTQGGKEAVKYLPGRRGKITFHCKAGVTNDMSLDNWINEVNQGQMSAARQNVTVNALDGMGTIMAAWEFTGAWPTAVRYGNIGVDSGLLEVDADFVAEDMKRMK